MIDVIAAIGRAGSPPQRSVQCRRASAIGSMVSGLVVTVRSLLGCADDAVDQFVAGRIAPQTTRAPLSPVSSVI
jgi:hypothetical protein